MIAEICGQDPQHPRSAATSIKKAVRRQQLLEEKRMERRLEIAREVQAGSLPERPPVLPGYEIAAASGLTTETLSDYGGRVG
jgi:serine phosphatase RsbU (regulator of sigma subunit)